MKVLKRKKSIFNRILCLLLCVTMVMTSIPFSANAATTQKKFIKAEPQVFVPTSGEKATITFNLENKHVVNVMIMDGKKVIAYLAKNKEYKGGYETHVLQWNGKDENGNYVNSGTYKVVVEPQDKYKKFKSITNIAVIGSNDQDLYISPNVNGAIFKVYGKGGKKQGVSKVNLSVTEDGVAGKTISATIGDNLWYAELPMSSYNLYNLKATISSSSGTSTKSISAVRHTFRVTDRLEYLASAYYGNYKKDADIIKDNGLYLTYTNSGQLVGSSILIINPSKDIKQEITSNNTVTNQHLGVIDQLQRTASMNPVSLTMGNNFYSNEDLYIDGYTPLSFTRMYNSMSESFHEFGINWSDSYSYLLQDLGSTVAIQFEDGHIEYYTKNEDGSYQAPDGMARKLKANANGTYTLTVDGTQIYDFTASGRIKTISDLNGNATTFTYYDGMLTKVENASGYFAFTYNTDGTIQSVKDSGDRSISYGYANGLVTSFTDAEGNKTTYSYDSYNRLNKVISPEKITIYAIEYDKSDRVTSKTVQGNTYKYSYNDTLRTIQCTEPNDNKITFKYTEDYRIESEEYSDGTIKYYYKEGSKKTKSGSANSDTSDNNTTNSDINISKSDNSNSDGSTNSFGTTTDVGNNYSDNTENYSKVTTKTNTGSYGNNEEQETVVFSINGTELKNIDNILELKTFNMNICSGSAVNNTLYPQFRVYNTSDADINLSDVTLRYYYTIDGEMPQNFFCDWSSIGAANITGKFVKLKTPVTGADYYMEVGFASGAGKLRKGDYVDLHTRIGKSDWSVFIPGDDYSQNYSRSLSYFDQVDMFYKGDLIWGKGSISGEGSNGPSEGNGNNSGNEGNNGNEGNSGNEGNNGNSGNNSGNGNHTEEEVIVPTGTNKLKIQMFNTGNSGSYTNSIHPMMRLINTGTNMVKLSDVEIRYYYTRDDDKPQNFWCDWSSAGTENITGTFHTMDETSLGADTYLEVGFKEGSGYIDIGATINLHMRIAKDDWSNYDITNDHSINPSESYKDWKKVDVYIKGVKVWGEDLTPEVEELEDGHIDYADSTYTPVRGEMYNANRESRSNTISPRFRVYNTSNEAIKLSDLKINYFYTTDGPEAQVFNVDWVGIGSRFQSNLSSKDVTSVFTEVDDENLKTNCLADIGFTRSDLFLNPGEYLELNIRIHRPDWTKYVQSNDYSLNTESTTYEEWNKISIFVGGRWAFGSMPLSYAEIVDPDPEIENEYPVDSKDSYGSGTDKAGNSTEYTYDDNGNITSSVDAMGNKTTNTHNELNQITSVTDALGNKTVYDYDSKGNLKAVTDALGNKTEYTYNSKGYLTEITRPDGSKETGTYDSRGNLKTATDGNGNTITLDYDILNRTTKYTDANGYITKYEYSPNGNLTKVTDALGFSSTVEFNKDGQVIKETDENGNVISYLYDKKTGLLSQTTDALSNVEKYQYDNMGNISSVTSADGGITSHKYDLLGRLESVTDAMGGKTTYTYDVSGNITEETDELGNVTKNTYDKLNRVIAQTDALNHTTTYEYDALGRTVKETDASGGVIKYAYDKVGNVIETTDALGNVTKNAYNSVGLLKSTTDAEGNKISYEYDKEGRQTKETDASGNITLWEYDKNDNLTKVTDANGNSSTYTYDKENQVTSITDAAGNKITYEYDGAGNMVLEKDALGNTTKYAYDALNNVKQITNALGKVTKYEYNAKSQLIKKTDANGNITSYSYDKNGNQEKVTNALSGITTYTYDSRNQLLEEKDAKGNIISNKYDANGNLISKTDARGNNTFYEYDSSNNLTKVTDALGHVTNYTYDKIGNLIKETRVGLISSSNQTTKYEYDNNGRLTKLTDPLGESISYVYNAEGQVTKETQKDGTTTGYQYDKVGNVKKVTYSDKRSVSYTYDNINQLKTMTDWNGTTTYEYDANGQTIKVIDPKKQVLEYTWTKLGQKKSITYTNGDVVSYEYDNNSNLTKVTDTNKGVTTYTYDALNQVKTRKLPNSAESLYTYDAIGQLTERNEKNGGILKDTFTYEYDKNGNRIKETKVSSGMAETTRYTYDVLNQLTDVTDKNGTRTYTFDEFNNRSTKEESGKLTTRYSYNSLNQLLEEDKGSSITTYSYDKRGNLSVVEENGITKQVFTFDSTNKLTKVVAEETTTLYGYDGAGNRINAKVTEYGSVTSNTNYVVDLESMYRNIIMATDTTLGKVSTFTFGNEQVGVETNGKISYYINDEKNSVTEILDEAGKVQATIQYDEYGVVLYPEVVNTSGNIFAYTGHVYEKSTGLYYAKARYYDSGAGRFISEDSLKGDINNPVSLNLYTYCNNNPIIHVDPTGHQLALAKDVTYSLSEALPLLIAGIATGMQSVKAAIASSWSVIIAVAAVLVAIASIAYVVHQAINLEKDAAKARAWVAAQVEAGGIDTKGLRNNTVYVIHDRKTLKVVYVGRTKDFNSRQKKHQEVGNAKFPSKSFKMIPVATGLSHSESRALEQALITAYTLGALNNAINSISPKKWGNFKYEFERAGSLISSYFDD